MNTVQSTPGKLDFHHLEYSDVQRLAALAAAAGFLTLAARRHAVARLCCSIVAAPFAYRGLTGHWPALCEPLVEGRDDPRIRLSGEAAGLHVRESIRLERPLDEVYRYWRQLENLPRFMSHLEQVTDTGEGRWHWVAKGPAGLRVAWDAEIINEVENQVIGWRSLPGSDVVTAGSVNFDSVRTGRSTQISIHLQYAPPAGRVGAFVSTLFGREPSQTIREDLRRLKQILETGEVAQAGEPPPACNTHQAREDSPAAARTTGGRR